MEPYERGVDDMGFNGLLMSGGAIIGGLVLTGIAPDFIVPEIGTPADGHGVGEVVATMGSGGLVVTIVAGLLTIGKHNKGLQP